MSVTPKAFPRFSLNLYGLLGIVLIIAAIGVYAVLRYSSTEEKREMHHWKVRLNLIADSRLADVNEWVEDQFGTLKGLADNTSLQLYMTELISVDGDRSRMTDEPAQVSILRNLLSATAQQRGFEPGTNSPTIPANVNPIGTSGLALVDNKGQVLIATQSMPPIEGAIADWLKQVPLGQQQLLDIRKTSNSDLQIGFTVPIFALQSESGANEQIGRVVGIRQVDDKFFARLKHPGTTETTLETILVRQDGENMAYLSPLLDNSAPLAKTIPANTEELEAAFALSHTGEFAIKRDYAFAKTLMTSRQVPSTPWRLVVKINRDEALAEGDAWRFQISASLLLAIALVAAIIIGAWWYGSSRHAMALYTKSNRLAAQTAAQEKLLRLVANNQPDGIFIVDNNNHYRFVNQKASEDVSLSADFMLGKDLASVMGPARAKDYVDSNNIALDTSRPVSRVWSSEGDGSDRRVIRSEHIPLQQIPIDSLPSPTPGVLVVDQDITEVMKEREGRERILNQLIGTLVKIVDQRDPFASNHSSLVAKVSRSVAEEMGLDAVTIETTETAGNLMNIGKIVVPSEVLTKNQVLSDAEMNAIRNSMQTSAGLLQGIDFSGPVVDTLRQAQENIDGTGPMGLKGDEILISARIIAVANNFVAMISPRSWRKAMPLPDATKSLLDQIDSKFDRKVVVALINYIENKGGRAEMQEVANNAPKELALA